ncbi:MAG: hypothetical protein AAGN35_03225 [Bacteroidota bacterium]
MLVLLTSCHSTNWNYRQPEAMTRSAPEAVRALFGSYPGHVLRMDALAPGYGYDLDIGEKDRDYGGDEAVFRFRKVEVRLHDRMPEGTVLTDFVFADGANTRVRIENVDLLRFIPKMDAEGDLIYPEIILEELNRFGLSFRREHREFVIEGDQKQSTLDAAYRAWIVNNCLLPGQWEFTLVSAEFDDFEVRRKSGRNLNQNRLIAHSWFQVPKPLYQALLDLKNPTNSWDVNQNFDSISNLAEQVYVDFNQLRKPIREVLPSKILEIGHQSGRAVEPLDREQFFKEEAGLYLNPPADLTYTSILEHEVHTAKFMDEGFYRREEPRIFDFSWMKHLDSVVVSMVDTEESLLYAEIRLTGKWSWFDITLGNVDLSQVSEQKLWGTLFGFNTYPKSRRYHPMQSTVWYDAELRPREVRPYLLLTDRRTGKWVNNQYKGIEKMYLTYSDREKDVLEIYVLSYERITPVWMARVKLPRHIREAVRVRKNLYNY